MSFNAIRENKILAKISESTVTAYADESSKARGLNLDRTFIYIHTLYMRAAKALSQVFAAH